MIKKSMIPMMVLAFLFLFSIAEIKARNLPAKFFELNTEYNKALEEDDYSNVALYGGKIVDLLINEPDSEQKVDIISSRSYETAFAYYFMGDYENAVKYFEIYIPYAIEEGWPDGVRIASEFIKQLTPRLDLYRKTNTPTVNYNSKLEFDGVLYGQVSERTENSDSMVLLYLPYGDESKLPLAKMTLREAKTDNKVVEIALNFVNEGDDARNINSSDNYLNKLHSILHEYSSVPVYLRIGAEVNVWSNTCTPEEYKNAYIIISNHFKDLPNVASGFSVAHTSRWSNGEWPYTADDFYPGDEYVDWVGVNLYCIKYFDGKKVDGKEKLNEVCFKSGYNADPVLMIKGIVDTYGDRKPIMIVECGSAHQTNGFVNEIDEVWAGKYLKEIYSYIPMVYPQVKLIAYFNSKNVSENNYFDINSSAYLTSIYEEMVKNDWFVQNDYSVGANVYFEKVDNKILIEDGAVSVGVYPHLYGADTINVDFYIDNKLVATSNSAPYEASFVGLSNYNKLRVVATGSNGSIEEREYDFVDTLSEKNIELLFNDVDMLSDAQKQAIIFLYENHIISGYEDGSFKPYKSVTRAEFATMICNLMNYTSDSPCDFEDAKEHWGTTFINACVKAGLINGVGDNLFLPDSDVTFEQAIKIITIALGKANGTEIYPEGYIEVATYNNLLDNIYSAQIERPLDRMDVVTLFCNAVKIS